MRKTWEPPFAVMFSVSDTCYLITAEKGVGYELAQQHETLFCCLALIHATLEHQTRVLGTSSLNNMKGRHSKETQVPYIYTIIYTCIHIYILYIIYNTYIYHSHILAL